MRKSLFISSLLALQCCFLAAQEQVILDTDPSFDPDDVGCIAMLHSMASQGECDILAIINSTNQQESALCISSINYFYNRMAIPVGDYHGYAEKINATENTYDFHIARDYPRGLENWEESLDGVRLYREILATATEKSITVVIIGTMHNFYGLLQSEADELSELDGIELVREKIKQVVTMGGNFLQHAGYDRTNWGGSTKLCPYTDWSCLNEERNRMCRFVIENCPAPFIASGWENGNGDYYNANNGNVITGQGLKELAENHIVRRSYERHFEYRGGADDISRHSNDQCALHYAIRGEADNYRAYTNGTITLSETGECRWDPTKDRQQGHIQKEREDEVIAAEIEALMMYPAPELDLTPPEAPTKLELIKNEESYVLRWQAASDPTLGSWVVAYEVYAPGQAVKRVYGHQFVFQSSQDLPPFFVIRAINASGTFSELASLIVK
ncbi:MAG: hypothetical protein AAF433_07675 [Bacteroidota bacterium]